MKRSKKQRTGVKRLVRAARLLGVERTALRKKTGGRTGGSTGTMGGVSLWE